VGTLAVVMVGGVVASVIRGIAVVVADAAVVSYVGLVVFAAELRAMVNPMGGDAEAVFGTAVGSIELPTTAVAAVGAGVDAVVSSVEAAEAREPEDALVGVTSGIVVVLVGAAVGKAVGSAARRVWVSAVGIVGVEAVIEAVGLLCEVSVDAVLAGLASICVLSAGAVPATGAGAILFTRESDFVSTEFSPASL